MDKVKVDAAQLLAKLKENREAHEELFKNAQIGYRHQMIKELDLMLEDAREGRKIKRHISLPEPVNHVDDYDRIITMVGMSVDVELELSEMEFNNYVMDNWSWKEFAVTTNSYYLGK